MLISNEIKMELDRLGQRFFWMNKKLDRMKSVLNVKFAMPKLAELVHHQLAHSYPLLADQVNDIEENFNYDVNYLGVEGANEDYEDVDALINQLYEWTLETNDFLQKVKLDARDAGNHNVYDLLTPISREYSKYVANAILLVDKKKQYGNHLYDMDAQAQDWWVL